MLNCSMGRTNLLKRLELLAGGGSLQDRDLACTAVTGLTERYCKVFRGSMDFLMGFTKGFWSSGFRVQELGAAF